MVDSAVSLTVQNFLLSSRRPSTREIYRAKLNRFVLHSTSETLDPAITLFPDILCYFMSLQESISTFSSLKLHLTIIYKFHYLIDGNTIFAHIIAKRFLKGHVQTASPVKTACTWYWQNLWENIWTQQTFLLKVVSFFHHPHHMVLFPHPVMVIKWTFAVLSPSTYTGFYPFDVTQMCSFCIAPATKDSPTIVKMGHIHNTVTLSAGMPVSTYLLKSPLH